MEHFVARNRRINEADGDAFQHQAQLLTLFHKTNRWIEHHRDADFVDDVAIGPLGSRSHYRILITPQSVATIDGNEIMLRIGTPHGPHAASSLFVDIQCIPEHGRITKEEYLIDAGGKLSGVLMDPKGNRLTLPIPQEEVGNRIDLLRQAIGALLQS